MTASMKPLNPGKTMKIGSPSWLTQIQHKGDHIDIVDHAHKTPGIPNLHIITSIDKDGKITTDVE